MESCEQVIRQFWELAEEASERYDVEVSTTALEPALIKMLGLIRQNLSCQRELEREFLRIIDTPGVAWEVVQFCMRELQWPAIRDDVIERIDNSSDPRVYAVMQSILDVYEEEWDDADLYNYYSKR